ncbi:kinase-like protein [Byssothecium circinans]|uniref:Kinase-like protein n=1 Tax=Byssothecium circinans TaxID=147558 RepID=A0A6A5U447_9PLEO|nr:kinase-like protein [Byssothecium circinans]
MRGTDPPTQANGTSQNTDRQPPLPEVKSARELDSLVEVFTIEDDGSHKFSRTTFAIKNLDDYVWYGEAPIRKMALSSKDIMESLKFVPDANLYPTPSTTITVISMPVDVDGGVFIKGPKIGSYDLFEGTNFLPNLLLQEAEIMELLRQNPHPNIIRYHGSIIKRGRIVGLVLDQHPRTLRNRVKHGSEYFNAKHCLDGIKLGVSHLHTLGLAHNDLTPDNIMVREDDTPVIIDFGSCQPFGDNLITAGTPGWFDEDFTTSARQHDEIAFGKLEAWLEERLS